MENNVVFRSPQPQVEAKEVTGEESKPHDIIPNADIEAPVALYESLKGRPYTAEYYEVSKIWDNPDLDMKSDVKAIEKYYVSQVQKNVVADGKDNYKKFIKGLEKAIGLSDMTPNTVRISKLAKYIKFMQEAERIDEKSRG